MISVCGIDPGAEGGIAIKYAKDDVVVLNMKNKTEVDVWEWFLNQKTHFLPNDFHHGSSYLKGFGVKT